MANNNIYRTTLRVQSFVATYLGICIKSTPIDFSSPNPRSPFLMLPAKYLVKIPDHLSHVTMFSLICTCTYVVILMFAFEVSGICFYKVIYIVEKVHLPPYCLAAPDIRGPKTIRVPDGLG